jgi:NADPH:quinone reductase-like Zn-dependent oxidoreductase
MKAILLRRPGGPSALEYVDVPTPRPCEGEVLVKADTIGVSMPEVLVRKGVLCNAAKLDNFGTYRQGCQKLRTLQWFGAIRQC